MDTIFNIANITFSPAFVDHIHKYKSTKQSSTHIITQNDKIDVSKLLLSLNDTDEIAILPSLSHDETKEIAEEHDAHPIKDIKDLIRIRDTFIINKQYRNNLLFIIGINTGLRCSDLRELKFSDIIKNENNGFRDEMIVLEKKTKNTRGKKAVLDNNDIPVIDSNGQAVTKSKPKNRHITINNAIRQAVKLYLMANPSTSMDDYLFRSLSNNGKNTNKPISRQGIQNLLVKITQELNIDIRAGTHCLRKTFCYHMITQAKDRSRALEQLQKLLGHGSISNTMRYAGITNDEMRDAYNSLNLCYEEIVDCNTNYFSIV